jgi:putative transposase
MACAEGGRPRQTVTGGLRAYSAATKEIGDADRQELGREPNNPAEVPICVPAVRRGMLQLRRMRAFQKFNSIHAEVLDHFNQERHDVPRRVYKQRRAVALAK